MTATPCARRRRRSSWPRPAPTASWPIRTAAAQAERAALIDPVELCKSGRALATAGKLREALSSFEMASECDAQNGTYAAEAAWVRYQLRSTPAITALKLLKNAIQHTGLMVSRINGAPDLILWYAASRNLAR